jgi:hypothetical protein
LLFGAIKLRGSVCVRKYGLCLPPSILVVLMALQHLLPAALALPASSSLPCCQPDSTTGSIETSIHSLLPLLLLLLLLLLFLQLPFFSSYTLQRPFIPDALTLNYFHTKFVYSLRKPMELAGKWLIGRTHFVLAFPHTVRCVLTTSNTRAFNYISF